VSVLLAALGGVLAWLGFAGVGLWPLALVAFVPLFAALERDANMSGRRALGLGLLFGTLLWGGACYWLVGTLRSFSGLPLPVCLAISLAFFVVHGGLYACFAWLWWRARRRGAPAALAAGAAIAASEWAWPQMFPGYYGASLHALPPVIQLAELGGPLALSALCLAVNGALYEFRARRQAGAVAACVLAATAFGALRIHQVEASLADAPRLRVGIVQPNMEALSKWTAPQEGQRRLVETTRQLEEAAQPDLIVWPENAWAAGLPDGITRVPESLTGGVRTPILLGAAVRRRVGGELHGWNRVLLVDAAGEIRGHYDKVELLPFSESMPLGDHIPWLRALPAQRGRLVPGERLDPLLLREWRISALVCLEDILPGFVRRVMHEGSPHLLVNLTNDAWFGDSHEPWIHLALSKLRAVEQRRYLVRATNTGVSAVIDPLGRVVAQADPFTRQSLVAEVAMLEGRTVYQALGDWPGWLAAGVIVWLAFLRRATR